MADDRHYVPGDNYILDDLSGFKIRASKARIIPGGQTGGLAVSPARWEEQQPQDYVTGVSDEIAADLVRSRQPNQFVILGTYVTAPSPRLSYGMTVASVAGFQSAMLLLIMLDTGVNQLATLIGATGNMLWVSPGLNATVGSYFGDPIENSIIALRTVQADALYNDGGVLATSSPFGWKTGATVGIGGVYTDGGAISVAAGIAYDPDMPPLYFGEVASGAVAAINGAWLPPPSYVTAGSGQLYSQGGISGGIVCVA